MTDFNEEDEVTSNFFKFENINDSIEGTLTALEDGEYGKQYVIVDDEGKKVTIGSYTALSTKIKDSDKGKKIKIVYLGEKKGEKSKRLYKDFKVFLK